MQHDMVNRDTTQNDIWPLTSKVYANDSNLTKYILAMEQVSSLETIC